MKRDYVNIFGICLFANLISFFVIFVLFAKPVDNDKTNWEGKQEIYKRARYWRQHISQQQDSLRKVGYYDSVYKEELKKRDTIYILKIQKK